MVVKEVGKLEDVHGGQLFWVGHRPPVTLAVHIRDDIWRVKYPVPPLITFHLESPQFLTPYSTPTDTHTLNFIETNTCSSNEGV